MQFCLPSLPERLITGDTIGIAAPAGCFDKKQFLKGVKILESAGFSILIPEDIFNKKGYLAGTDMQRASLVNTLFGDNSVKAIMCARGGFGSIRVLPFLDFDLIQRNPKIFIGFSDITVLLSVLYQKCKMVAFHGPVVTTLKNISLNPMLKAVASNNRLELKSAKSVVIKHGKALGPVIGGNLSTLCHLIGTPFEPDFTKHILLLEDICEPSYKIDRMLTQMKLAGCFEKLAGLILGSFEQGGMISEVYKIVNNIFHDYNIPILAGFDAGHGYVNTTIPLGIKACLDTEQGGLLFQSPSTIESVK